MSRIPKIPCPHCGVNLAAGNLYRTETVTSREYMSNTGPTWDEVGNDLQYYECFSCQRGIHDGTTLDLIDKWVSGWTNQEAQGEGFEDE